MADHQMVDHLLVLSSPDAAHHVSTRVDLEACAWSPLATWGCCWWLQIALRVVWCCHLFPLKQQ